MSCAGGGGLITGVFRSCYGAFCDTTEQTASLANTAYSMRLNTTELSNQIYIVSGSQITFLNTGIYDLQFSAQFINNVASAKFADIWLTYTGSNVPNTNTQVLLAGSPAKAVAAWDFMFKVEKPYDYVELKWSTEDTGVKIHYATTGSNPTRPAIPSLIVTVMQI